MKDDPKFIVGEVFLFNNLFLCSFIMHQIIRFYLSAHLHTTYTDMPHFLVAGWLGGWVAG